MTVEYATVALAVSIGALLVSVSAMADAYRKWISGELREVTRGFCTGDVRAARVTVRRVGERRRLRQSDRVDFEDAALTIMWSVQMIEPSVRHIKGSAYVVKEATILYRHVGAAIQDLAVALWRHGLSERLADDVRATNDAVKDMPPIRNTWHRKVGSRPEVRLPIPGSDAS